jgi:hypothetical protein
MPIINGSAQIFMPHFEPVRLAGHATIVLPTGAKQTARQQTGKARIRHAVSAAEIQNCPPIDSWINVAYNNPSKEKALDLWGGLEHTWRNLYLVLEVMEDAAGGTKTLLTQPWLPDKTGIERFKRTANNWRALGSDARHATEQFAPPRTPMSLPEAQELIRQTLELWLQQP